MSRAKRYELDWWIGLMERTCRAAFDTTLPNGVWMDDCVVAEEKCQEWAKDPVSLSYKAHSCSLPTLVGKGVDR